MVFYKKRKPELREKTAKLLSERKMLLPFIISLIDLSYL